MVITMAIFMGIVLTIFNEMEVVNRQGNTLGLWILRVPGDRAVNIKRMLLWEL